MDEIRLIDANKLEYCIEYLRPELEEHRNSVQRCIEVFTQSVGNQPTIDPETLPIVRDLREENQKLTSLFCEAKKSLKDLKIWVDEMDRIRKKSACIIGYIYLQAIISPENDTKSHLDWFKETIEKFDEFQKRWKSE